MALSIKHADADRLQAIGRRYNALPVLDHRPDDEILGYDDLGVPR